MKSKIFEGISIKAGGENYIEFRSIYPFKLSSDIESFNESPGPICTSFC